MPKHPEVTHTPEEIRDMLKLIGNGVPVCYGALVCIFGYGTKTPISDAV